MGILAKGLREAGSCKDLRSLQNLGVKVFKYCSRKIINTAALKLSNTFSTEQEYQSILVLESTDLYDGWGIGDGFFKKPSYALLRKRYPKASIALIVYDYRNAIFNEIKSPFDSIHIVKDNLHQVSKSLRKKSFDLVISHIPSGRKDLMKVLSSGLTTPYLITNYGSYFSGSKKRHHIDTFSGSMATSLGLPWDQHKCDKPSHNMQPTLEEWGKELIDSCQGNTIAISIGYKDLMKKYDKRDIVLNILQERLPDTHFFLLGGSDAVETAKGIQLGDRIHNYAGKLALEQSFSIIRNVHLMVGIDGGLTNAAIAMDTPTLMLFNILDADDIIPIKTEADSLTTLDVGCDSSDKCYYDGYPHTCSTYQSDKPQCLENLTPHVFAEAILKKMQDTYLSQVITKDKAI